MEQRFYIQLWKKKNRTVKIGREALASRRLRGSLRGVRVCLSSWWAVSEQGTGRGGDSSGGRYTGVRTIEWSYKGKRRRTEVAVGAWGL